MFLGLNFTLYTHTPVYKYRKYPPGIISFVIAMDSFSFPAFIKVSNKEYKGFQLGKATVKVSLLFA